MLLEISEVTIRFGGVVALDKVSFSVEENKIVGIIGPNGAGKTSLFNVIDGIYKPTEGDVIFKGDNITGCKPHEVCRKGIARTFQIAQPFKSMSVLDNVIVAGLCHEKSVDVSSNEAKEHLDFCGLHDKKNDLAGNLPTIFQRRLELAKALATHPKVILLDEIMAGLNINECDQAVELVRKLKNNGITVMMVEHVMRAVMALSDWVIVLNRGKLLMEGPPQYVANDPKVIEAYLGKGVSNAGA